MSASTAVQPQPIVLLKRTLWRDALRSFFKNRLAVTGLDTMDGFKFMMGDEGWLLIRLSGTEPIVRVYTETTHQDKVQAILRDGLKIAGLK